MVVVIDTEFPSRSDETEPVTAPVSAKDTEWSNFSAAEAVTSTVPLVLSNESTFRLAKLDPSLSSSLEAPAFHCRVTSEPLPPSKVIPAPSATAEPLLSASITMFLSAKLTDSTPAVDVLSN